MLVEFYNATNGDNWKDNTNWLSDKPLAEWYGIETTNWRVTEVDLHDNNLSGPIPASLGNLTQLIDLRLYDNQLSGPIPTELGNLSNLTELNLSTNQLSGSIPESIGNLSNLERLDLSNNQLQGRPIPQFLRLLSDLTSLYLAA